MIQRHWRPRAKVGQPLLPVPEGADVHVDEVPVGADASCPEALGHFGDLPWASPFHPDVRGHPYGVVAVLAHATDSPFEPAVVSGRPVAGEEDVWVLACTEAAAYEVEEYEELGVDGKNLSRLHAAKHMIETFAGERVDDTVGADILNGEEFIGLPVEEAQLTHIGAP